MAGELNLPLIILETGAIVLDFIVGSMLVRKTVTIGKGSMRTYYIGVIGFFFAHGTFMLTRVIFLFTNDGLLYNFGVFLVLSSIVLLVAAIEFTMFTKSHHIFTIFGCVSVGLIFIDVFAQFKFPIMPLMVWVQYFANPILVLFILLIYFNAARRARGPARRNALLMLIAIITFAIGELGQSQTAIKYIPDAELIGTILMDVAIVLLYYGFMHLSIWKREAQQQVKKTSEASTSRASGTSSAE
ncbi:MAG TPA: hypothetical protein VKM55_23860 [Candidatus Lokiarchaeia archaeon]|nr:hypothetical protein [Candidatus Lokiarchaeia archaeon]